MVCKFMHTCLLLSRTCLPFCTELQQLIQYPHTAVDAFAVAPNLPGPDDVDAQDVQKAPDRFSVCVATMAVTNNECILYYVNCINTSTHDTVWCTVSTYQCMYQNLTTCAVFMTSTYLLCSIRSLRLIATQDASLGLSSAHKYRVCPVTVTTSMRYCILGCTHTYLCMYLHRLCKKHFFHPLERWACFMPHCAPNHGGE